MERLTGKQVKSLAEAYQQVYFNPEEQVEVLQEESEQILEYTRFVDRPGQPVAKPNNQKRQEAERLAAAQRSARETVDRRQGRASVNPQTGLRYTVQPGNVRRSEGQEATLGGKSVQWSVDKSGKRSWVPRETEGEMARRLNQTKQTPPARPAAPAATTPARPAPAATTPARPAPPATPVASNSTPLKPAPAATTPAKPAPPATPVASNSTPVKSANPLMRDMPGQNKSELEQIRGNAAIQSISQSTRAKQILGGTARSAAANQIGRASLDRSAASIEAKPAPASAPAPTNRVGTAFASSTGNLAPGATKVMNTPVSQLKKKQPAIDPKTGTGAARGEDIFNSVDLFDIIKGHLMSEGASEQEALRLMVIMPEEEKMSIVDMIEQYGSIGANMAGAELQRRLELRVREQERKKIEQEKRESSGASSQVKGA